MRSRVVVSLLFLVSMCCLGFSNVYANDIDALEIYAEKCALCHGEDGKGTSTGIDFGVKDFTDKEWQASRTDDEFVHSITHGNPDNDNYLPFGDMLSEEEIVAMVPHVRAFAH
ncbi:MAG: cytochrome c [Candidatus Scalindua sp.]|nr:cytochrome c [Candidatus Scalindua sp.]MCR4343864.1 cytochrome c [Candidatus Scalindua sp.]